MSNWFAAYGFADVHRDLIIGAYPLDADDVGTLHSLGIERVLNLVEDREYEPGQREEVAWALDDAGIDEARLRLPDYGHLPADAIDAAVAEVTDWLSHGERSYIHCRAGWQRSAAVAAAVIAVMDGIEVEDALEVVHQRKPSANPLPHQREELLAWWHERQAALREGSAGEQTG